MNKYKKWSLICLVVAILCLLLASFVFFGNAKSAEGCQPVWTFYEHRYCDGGTYTLLICSDGEFVGTCLGIPVTEDVYPYPVPTDPSPYPAPPIISFLPLIANAFDMEQ